MLFSEDFGDVVGDFFNFLNLVISWLFEKRAEVMSELYFQLLLRVNEITLSVLRAKIMVFLLCCIIDLWKKAVCFSPHLSQLILDFCFYNFSSWMALFSKLCCNICSSCFLPYVSPYSIMFCQISSNFFSNFFFRDDVAE